MTKMTQILGICLLILGLASTAASRVKTIKHYDREMLIEMRGKRIVVSFLCPEVFSARVRQRLSSGFTSTVGIQLHVLNSKDKPMAQGFLQYTIRYDLWEEMFAVRIVGQNKKQVIQTSSMDELTEKLSSVRLLPLDELAQIDLGQKYWLQVRVVVNPVSPELQRKVREYVANPDGHRTLGKTRSFFGSFSRIFVDETDIQADAVLIYSSKPKMIQQAREKADNAHR